MSKSKKLKHKKYKEELARMVYDKHGRKPPEDELEYNGRAKGFLILPIEIIYAAQELSHGAFRLWLLLFKHNWNLDPTYRVSWPGRERLAVLMGISTRQVTVYLNELREKGLLLSRRRVDKTTLYVLLDPPRTWMRNSVRRLKEKGLANKNEIFLFSRQDVKKTSHSNVKKTSH